MSDDELREYHGNHVVWCGLYGTEFSDHSADEDEPYCAHMVTGVDVIPHGGAVKCTAWVSATNAFTHGYFTPAEHAARERLYDGVEICVESWDGPEKGWAGAQKIRITSDAARTLAAALIRAADIEQGLSR